MNKLPFQKKLLGTGGSRLGLSINDIITVENLLYGLMMVSGNDAAVALAEFIGGDIQNFANLMNEKAQILKLTSTHFISPHGLDNDEHFTTAYDLALLTDYALQNETFSKIVKTPNYTISINNHSKQLNNTNELLGYLDGVYGVKTGFTNGANRCLVTACKRNDLDIICIVLGCDTKKDRTQDSIKLINYIFNNYTIINIKYLIETEFENWKSTHSTFFNISKGKTSYLELYIDDASFPFSNIALNKFKKNDITIDISCDSYLEAPKPTNFKIGEITLYFDKLELYSVDILTSNEITKKNIADYFYYFLANLNFFLFDSYYSYKSI